MHSVYISADCLSSSEFSSRAASLGGGRVSRNGRCVFLDFLFTIVATRFVSQLRVSVSTTLEWSGALFVQQLPGVGAGRWVRL